ncbi:hypothetical protein [Actinoalloteichus spitiensis]|uniref:hypothetical protein n=1 Tax=Actinoalloteichus spitiensis TaxID=252394 RepID=UPI00031527D8|nr:hypothetical protein [Actinoalloteichus spitiensis]
MTDGEKAERGPVVLSVGLRPDAVDLSGHPDLDHDTLAAMIASGQEALGRAGIDNTNCLVSADPEEAERQVREEVAGRRFDLVMIGGGVRLVPEQTVLFERIVNLVVDLMPGVRFCFNTSPGTTLDSIRRWWPQVR